MTKIMKTILYMAMTINGFIAKENDETDWISEDEWKSFSEAAKRIGVMVIGRRTYEVMSSDQFLPEVFYIVKTSHKNLDKKTAQIEFTDGSPGVVLKIAEQKGFKEVCIAGGSHINTLFMREGLIDELFLDVEPLIFGNGISLFKEDTFEYSLQLLNIEKLNENLIQLHYKVLK